MQGRIHILASLSLPSFSTVATLSLGCEMLLSPQCLGFPQEVAGAEVVGGI